MQAEEERTNIQQTRKIAHIKAKKSNKENYKKSKQTERKNKTNDAKA